MESVFGTHCLNFRLATMNGHVVLLLVHILLLIYVVFYACGHAMWLLRLAGVRAIF